MMKTMYQPVYIGLGSNVGNSTFNVTQSIEEINGFEGTEVVCQSSLYQSAPMGPIEQNDFINAVIEIRTPLSPFELFEELKKLETKMGRVEMCRWGPRVIDCDILFFERDKIQTEIITIPHVGVLERSFVLIPLYEIAPDFIFLDGQKLSDVVKGCATSELIRLEKELREWVV